MSLCRIYACDAARKPRSNDSSGGLRASAKNAQGMSMEQADRAMLKVRYVRVVLVVGFH